MTSRYYLLRQGIKEVYKLPLLEAARHIKSLLRFFPFQPRLLEILVTHRCNSRCIMCSMWKSKPQNELITSEIFNILDQAREELEIKRVRFSGGEPLLRQDLAQLVRKAQILNFETIEILTNGFLLNEEKAKELLENGVNKVGVSLDGVGQTMDEIRGIKGSYEKVINGLRILLKLRDKSFPSLNINIAMNLMRRNLEDLPAIINLAHEIKGTLSLNLLGSNEEGFQFEDKERISKLKIENGKELDEILDRLRNAKRKKPKLVGFNYMGIELLKKAIKDLRMKEIPCINGYLAIFVDSHGNLFSGCWALPPLGSLRESKLTQFVNSEKYRERLKEMFLKRCPGCSCAYQANLWYHPPSVLREVLLELKAIANPFGCKGKWERNENLFSE